MFKFLKLHSSSSGDARRHVPFASIIHKHIFPVFFITILFLTLFFRPYAAEALAQLTPEIQPVYDTTIESLYEFVKVQLDDTHKQVFDLFLGSYMVGYAGMANYKLGYVYNSNTPVKEWLINTGADLYNTILSLGGIAPSGSSSLSGVPNIGYQQLSPLLQYAMGCAIKSKQYNDADDALNDIQTSDNFPIPLKPDIMYSINAAMGYYNGVNNWQYQVNPFETTITYDYQAFSGTYLDQYNAYVAQYSKPVRYNINYSTYHNGIIDIGSYADYHNLFIDTDNQKYFFCNDNGLKADYTLNTRSVSAYFSYGTIYSVSQGGDSCNYARYEYDLSNFNSYAEAAQYIFNHTVKTRNENQTIFVSDFCDHVYYGTDWQHKQELTNITDLNYDVPDAPTYYPGVENGLLDLRGLLEDILGELQLRPPVINNYYYPDGENVPVADMEPATTNNSLPDSGVDIDQGLFDNLFRSEGKDTYISYLWYMTKPLILYTKDLFNCLIFDPVENFAASGPGYFVYGVVSLGLISGLLVKCLL